MENEREEREGNGKERHVLCSHPQRIDMHAERTYVYIYGSRRVSIWGIERG